MNNKILALILSVLLIFPVVTGAEEIAIPADIQNNPEIHVINTLLQNSIVSLCPDGRFRPDHFLTRAEAFEWMDKLLNRTETTEAERSEEFITRAELAAVLYDHMKTLPSFDNTTYWFPDVPAENLAVGYVRSKNVMFGRPDGGFHPDDYVTRAEFCNAAYAVSNLHIIYASDNLPRKSQITGPYVSQLSPVYAVVGCEGASLLMGLKAKGYAQNVGLREFLDNMPKHGSNPAKGYVGSPYKARQYSLRTTIYPAPLAEYGKSYGSVTDISGSSPRELQAELLCGNPVVIYATMRWEEPRYRSYDIEGEQQLLLRNNHVVLADGYDRDTGMYHISDPYNDFDTSEEYRYWIDGAVFEKIYNVRRHAVAIE